MTKPTGKFSYLVSDIKEVPEILNQNKIPSIDGFRAVSIMLVVAVHLGHTDNAAYNRIFNGSLGVNIFFVISGFLITSLLLKEKAISGTIALKNFYVRRALRIFPVAYLYLVVIMVLNYIFKLHVSPIYLAAAFFYVSNFKFLEPYKSVIIGHYWSLSVEEQFYVIFPFILKKNFKVFLFFILFIIFILPFLIDLQFRVPAFESRPLFIFTHYLIKFQGIAVGCLFSIIVFKNMINFKSFVSVSLPIKLVCIFLMLLLNHTAEINQYSVYSNLAISLLTALLITMNLFFTNDFMYRFLNLKWVMKIGVLSYSIYIWQQLFLYLDVFPKWMTDTPISLIFIALVSWLSYEYWEKFFLRLKKRFSPNHQVSQELKKL